MAKRYISLKEAAELSGYAPDYVGQLIRAGKIPGRQVYSNIAWTTTEEAVLAYLKKMKKQKNDAPALEERLADRIYEFKNRITMELQFTRFVRWILYTTIGASAIFAIILFYIFSVNFDRKFQEKALEGASVPIEDQTGDTPHALPF